MKPKAGREVDIAVVAGRADRQQVDDPFAIRVENVDDFIPQ